MKNPVTAAQKFKVNENLFKLLIHSVKDYAIFMVNPSGHIMSWNKGAENLKGYTTSEILGKHISIFYTKEEIANNEPSYNLQMAKKEGTHESEGWRVRKDGSLFWANIVYTALYDDVGNFKGFAKITRDMTERKKSENKIAYLAKLVEDTNAAIFSMNLASIILSWNRAAENLYGHSAEEAIGRSNDEILKPQVNEAARRFVRRELLQKGHWKGELTHLKKDGTCVIVLISISVTRNANNVIDGYVCVCRDITDKKLMEEQLKKFNEDLELQVQEKSREITNILARINKGFFSLDINGNFTYINKKGTTLIAGEEEIIGKNIWEVYTPEKISFEFFDAYHAAVKEQKSIRIETYSRFMNLWFDVSIYPSSKGISIFLEDITEKKKTEQALKYGEEMRRMIMDSSLNAIISIDALGCIILWNRKAEELFGWKEEDVKNKTLTETIIPVAYREMHATGLKHYLETGEGPLLNKIIEITALNRKGEEFSIELLIVPFKRHKEQFFCAFIRDITERKEAEEKLLKSEHKYKLLFENSPMPMWMLSLEDLSILDVNKAAIDFYGYTKEEFLSLNMKDLRPAEELQKFHTETQKHFPVMKNRGIWKHKKKDGSVVCVQIIAQDFEYNGKHTRLVLSKDVTESLKAKRELKKSYEDIRQLASHLQKVREEERADMAREIHDELGQQLTGLKMDISWLNKKLGETEEPIKQKIVGIKELLDETIKTVRRIATELRPSILDDLGLVETIRWYSQEFEKRSGIQVQFHTSIPHVDIAKEFSIGLFRIYQESLTNVARHANATIIATTLHQSEDNRFILTITDNGQGFNISDVKRKKTLGLLGMEERTLLMGGKYEIVSATGKGTMVIVSVPCSKNFE